jgi:hypothetical protein
MKVYITLALLLAMTVASFAQSSPIKSKRTKIKDRQRVQNLGQFKCDCTSNDIKSCQCIITRIGVSSAKNKAPKFTKENKNRKKTTILSKNEITALKGKLITFKP